MKKDRCLDRPGDVNGPADRTGGKAHVLARVCQANREKKIPNQMTVVHEVFDPQTRTWTTAAPMLRARSGMNGVMARGCFHVWGGEGPNGMFADHDYYDPRTNEWIRLHDMPTPVHGVYGSAFMYGLIWAPGGGTHIGGNHGSLHHPGLLAGRELRVSLFAGRIVWCGREDLNLHDLAATSS
jgi:hypothetical protein